MIYRLRKNNNPIWSDDILDIGKYTINYASGRRPSIATRSKGCVCKMGHWEGGIIMLIA